VFAKLMALPAGKITWFSKFLL